MRAQLRGLYAITDARQTNLQKLIVDVEQALLGGAHIIQYRDKSADPQQRLEAARALRKLTRQHHALFIVNDDPALAKATQADGVHLGQDDTNLEAARSLLGENAIIGVSCYNRFELAQRAHEQGADYVAFGRFFASSTKPDTAQADPALLQRAQQELATPVVAIGGITAENAGGLIEAGAHMLAVVNDIFGQSDIQAAARRYQQLFTAFR